MTSTKDGAVLRQLRALFDLGATGELTDGQLLERFTTGRDEAGELACAALVERHGAMVFRVCRSVLRDPDAARDAFQATFLVLVRRARSLWVLDSLGPWLHQVAYRTALCARATEARRLKHERRASELAAASQSTADADASLGLEQVLHEEINRLPERFRVPILLCDLEGLTCQEAATRLGRPVGTIKSWRARGRKQLRARITRRGLAPSAALLGARHSETAWAEQNAGLARCTARAATRFAAGGATTRAMLSPTMISLTERVLTMMSLTKLKICAAALLVAGCVAVAAHGFVPPTNASAGAKVPSGTNVPEPTIEPPLEPRPAGIKPSRAVPPGEPDDPLPDSLLRPKPWETAVRIKVHGNNSIGFGSGTIISSRPRESIVLCHAHIFKTDDNPQPAPAAFNRRITVDLFDGTLSSANQVHYADETVEGRAIDYDLSRDVGLIRIRPGRRLPYAPIVPKSWKPSRGMRLITVGCSLGSDATAWATAIVNPSVRAIIGNAEYEAIECTHAPKQGRSGGGLFTHDGYVAGVCDFSDPRQNRGLYATPASIHRLLDRNGLAALYGDENPLRPRPLPDNSVPKSAGPAQGTASSNQEQRLSRVERKLDLILKALDDLRRD